MTKRGDIWQLGDHRLLCGDSVTDDVTALFKGKVRLIATDPPYGVAYVENKAHFKKDDGDTQISVDRKIEGDQLQTPQEYAEFSEKWLNKISPHLEDYNAVYIFNADLMINALREGFLKAGYYYSQTLIWIKNSVVVGRKDYLPQHELILYGWFGKHKFERSKDKTVINYPKPSRSKLHPTMKPVGLMRRIILNGSSIGDAVYDPFSGSGSTLIACEHTKRKCYGVEVDPVYCDTIIKRWEKLTGKKAELVGEIK